MNWAVKNAGRHHCHLLVLSNVVLGCIANDFATCVCACGRVCAGVSAVCFVPDAEQGAHSGHFGAVMHALTRTNEPEMCIHLRNGRTPPYLEHPSSQRFVRTVRKVALLRGRNCKTRSGNCENCQ